MRKFTLPALLCLFLSLFTCSVFGQAVRYSIAMPYTSLGAYTSSQTDPFGFTNNQAALAQVKSATVGAFGERRFMLSENSVYGLAAAIPTTMGNFGVQVNYAGFENFNEHKAGLAYGRKLGKALDVGVQFNYYGYRIPQYGNASAVNFEIGAIMHLTERLNAGVHVYNPVGGEFTKSADEKLASAYKLGLGYDASDQFYVSAEIVKEEGKDVNVIGGFQYQFKKQFFARGGFISETGSGFAGFGVGWNNLRLDLSGSYHPQLGFSPGLMFVVHLKDKEQ